MILLELENQLKAMRDRGCDDTTQVIATQYKSNDAYYYFHKFEGVTMKNLVNRRKIILEVNEKYFDCCYAKKGVK